MKTKKSKGIVRRVALPIEGEVRVRVDAGKKAEMLAENARVMRELRQIEVSLLRELKSPNLSSYQEQKIVSDLMLVQKEQSSLAKTGKQYPSLRSPTFQEAVGGQIKSRFVSKPGVEGQREFMREKNQVIDFINAAEEAIQNREVITPGLRDSLQKRIKTSKEYLKELEVIEEAQERKSKLKEDWAKRNK